MLTKTERSTISWKKGETDFTKTLYALAKIEKDEFYMQQEKKDGNVDDYWPQSGKKYAKSVKFAKKNGFGTYFKQIRRYAYAALARQHPFQFRHPRW